MDTQEANDLLPQTKSVARPDPLKLNYLLIAPPKWGKTTWMGNIPDSILLAFEQGHSFQSTFKIVIDAWEAKNYEIWEDENDAKHMTMVQATNLLTVSDRFSFITLDTADMAARMCMDYFLKRGNWQHASEAGDFGKGHDITQNNPFRQMVGRLMRTGRGIGFITHTNISTTPFATGAKVKKETSLPNGVFKFLHTQADVILHGDYGQKQKGVKYRERILKTEGDAETLAGSRVRDLVIPAEYVVDPDRPWDQWANFFTDPKAAEEAERKFHSTETVEETSEATATDETAATKKKKKHVKTNAA